MDDGLVIGGKYRLKKLIGSGGMGQVWIGRNEMTERDFAIKLLLPQAATNREVVTRFVQEAKIWAGSATPGILEIFDVGTAPELNGAPFLVMELLQGVSLESAIRSLGGLPLRFTLLVTIAVTRALGAAHDKGVVHRDLKPANVFLHRDDSGALVPKLLDFGISKLASMDAAGDDAMGLTQTGALLGSPRFMSPEQIATQKDIDGRSDLHALGVLVWWCLLARSPFEVSGFHNLMLEILSDRRPRLQDVMPGVPPGLSELVTRAIARSRDDRQANAAEVLVALEAELAKLGPGPTLHTRAWVDEVLARVVSPAPPEALLPPHTPAGGKDSTTHGAVSVSLEGGDPASPRSLQSPAAHTLDAQSPWPTAVAGVPKRPRPATFFALGIGGLLLALTLVGGLLAYGRPGHGMRAAAAANSTPRDISADAWSAAPPLPGQTPETLVTASPAPLPAAPAADSGVAQAAVPAASAPRPQALPLRAVPRAVVAKPPGTPPTGNPFHGVTGTGL